MVKIISDNFLGEILDKTNNIILKWRTKMITSLDFSNTHFTITNLQ